MEAWTHFFVRAGIPKDIAAKYAKSFHTNRITKQMLPEIDKATLSELGVSAIGDQLCILKRIKAAKIPLEKDMGKEEEDEEMEQEEPAPRMASRVVKTQITGPESHSSSSASTASELRRGKPPPDRNEIYHVKMPVGNTHRTRQILQKAEKMRAQGLAVRGTTGVRQGGRSVSPVDKSSLAARIQKKQSAVLEVSSTTDQRRSHHGGHGAHQATKISRISTSSIKKTVSSRPSLSSRLSAGPSQQQTVRLLMEPPQKTSRIEGRLQRANDSGDSRRQIQQQRQRQRQQQQEVVLEYEDDDLEYEEDMEEVVLEDDQIMYEDEYEDVEEEDDDVLTVPPLHQRITYSSGPSSASRRAPISAPRSSGNGSSSRNSRNSSSGIHSRISYR